MVDLENHHFLVMVVIFLILLQPKAVYLISNQASTNSDTYQSRLEAEIMQYRTTQPIDNRQKSIGLVETK